MIARRATRAAVVQVSRRDPRRTLLSGLLDTDADLVSVQRFVGDAQVSTTQRPRARLLLLSIPSRRNMNV